MADVTILGRWQMTCLLHSIRVVGNKSSGMTTFAATYETRMHSRQKCRRGETTRIGVIVTLAAFSLCRDVISMLGHRDARVMAGCTIIVDETRIMEKSARECIKGAGTVARRAIQVDLYQIGLHMTNRLASTDRAVMARRAIAANAHVVKRCICKVGDIMANGAILAIGSGRYVIRQLPYTDPVVVARIAAITDTGMVVGACAEATRGMANTAILQGRHVGIERGAKRHTARSTGSICNVTGEATITHDASMIEDSVSETHSVMTHATILSVRGTMIRRQSGRVNTGAVVVA